MRQFIYALELAWRGMWRSSYITVLSVLVLALGIGTAVTAYSVTRLVAGDPLPNRSGSLYQVHLDSAGLTTLPPDQSFYGKNRVTLLDARQIEAAAPKTMQTVLINTHALTISVLRGDGRKSITKIHGLEVQSDFFPMFDVPFVTGHRWSHVDDANAAPVVVISQRVARRLFGDGKAVGKMLRISGHSFRVIGVTGHWKAYPHFYGLNFCMYSCKAEEVFIPVSAARAALIFVFDLIIGNPTPGPKGWCYRGKDGISANHCPYLSLWVLLPTITRRAAYRTMLAHYASAQKEAGRISHGGMAATALYSIRDVLDAHHVVPFSARFGAWVATVFLLICLVSVAGLLLTRTVRGAVELGIRRALGATRAAIFTQCLIEGGLIGLFSGVIALPLVWTGLWLVHQQSTAYASVVSFHWAATIMLLTLASICGGALIGVIPAWRAATVDAGLQVKEQ